MAFMEREVKQYVDLLRHNEGLLRISLVGENLSAATCASIDEKLMAKVTHQEPGRPDLSYRLRHRHGGQGN